MSQTAPAIAVLRHKGVIIVELIEPSVLEPQTIWQISASLRSLADETTAPLLLLDFARVTRLSSAALGMLVEMHQHARNRGGQMCLANIALWLQEVFRITRLDEVLCFAPTRQAGVALLTQPGASAS